MRVTLVTDRYAPEARAAAYLSHELAKGLASLGHNVSVITRMPTQFVPDCESAPPEAFETVDGVEVTRVSGITASSRIWLRLIDQLVVSAKILCALWTATRPDVILIYSPPLALSLVAVLMAWVRHWPYVLNLHDLYPQTAIDLGILRNPLLIWMASHAESLLYRNAARIVVAAPASKRILVGQKSIAADRIEIIFNYVDTTVCTPGPLENGFRARNALEGRFVVLFAGLMGLAQDLTPVVEVARSLQNESDWVFVLAGDGPRASHWTQLTEGLMNVKMIGLLSYSEYYEALRASDVCLVALSASFVTPAIPGKVSTIMAAGRPLVASVPLGNDTREVLRAARSGSAVRPDRPQELMDVLKVLKERPELRSELGSNGAGYAALHFEAVIAVKKFEKVLREVHQGHTWTTLASESPDRP